MREFFENRTLDGEINVACKFDDGSVRYWTADKSQVVKSIIRIVNEYASDGYILTLRQLHYQMVANDSSYVNHDTAYKKLGSILDDCRYAGLIDWDAIEDRGRRPYIPYSVRDVEHALQDTVEQYRLDRQDGQENHVEIWSEKDALSGILKRITEEYHVRLVINKGYTSSSAAYNAYERCVKTILAGKKMTILYFGDHDPSGIDMIRDIKDRLLLFLSQGKQLIQNLRFKSNLETWWESEGHTINELAREGYFTQHEIKHINRHISGKIESEKVYDLFQHARIKFYLESRDLFRVIPIGLTMQQIRKYKLPPNPTKLTDSRSDKYIAEHGKTCWEVDALKPQVLTDIVESNIQAHIDVGQFKYMIEQENKQIEELKEIIKNRKSGD